MPDQNDEPQRRRRPDAEPGSARPTRDARPDFGIGPDLDGAQNLGRLEPLRTPPQGDGADRARAPEPELRRADRDASRQRAGGVGIPDELRGYLDRLGDIEDEISDAEAARRAGLDTDLGDEPVPPEYQDLPAVIRNDLANMGGEIAAAGEQYPEWHTINNLPGYMKNAIRAMGRGNFRMFTRTDLEDIITIANLGGKGPNTEAEVKAVAGWLLQNAENLGPVDIDYSRIMPGYEPEVVEFRTEKTRFHVVRDPGGVYIYAYPEKDAVDRTGQGRLEGPGGSSDEEERDEYGALIKKRISKESKMENKFSSVTEQIRHYTNVLESLQEQALEEQQSQQLWEELVDHLFEASSLYKQIKGHPGARSLSNYLHKRFKLAAGAGRASRAGRTQGGTAFRDTEKGKDEFALPGADLSITPMYRPIASKNYARAIKFSTDNFAIVLGERGIAGIKLSEESYQKGVLSARSRNVEYRPEFDNTAEYRVVWTTDDKPPETEIKKFRAGTTDGKGGSSGMEGGAENIMEYMEKRIGKVKEMLVTQNAIERMKEVARANSKQIDDPISVKGRARDELDVDAELSTGVPRRDAVRTQRNIATDPRKFGSKIGGDDYKVIADRLNPILNKLLNSTVGNIQQRAARLVQAGNFSASQNMMRTAEKLQQMQTALDADNPNYSSYPLSQFMNLVRDGVEDQVQGMDSAERQKVINDIKSGGVQNLSQLFNYVKDSLYKLN